MTKLLTWQQVRWSEYLSQFNMVICFWPWKLRMKLDALTRWWDIYLKEGGSDYGTINLQNLSLIFTAQQLSEPLRAMSLLIPALRTSVLMDSEQLHANILAHLSSDPVAQKHIRITSDLRWTQSDDGFLWHNNWIYVPEAGNLWLQVLQYKHDHVLLGHFCCYSLSKRIYSDAKEAEQESGASEIGHRRPVHICVGTCQSLM